MIRVKAPGKLFLLGEYVVLFGGPAVLISVDRYLTVTVEPASDGIAISSRGADLRTICAHWEQRVLKWSSHETAHELAIFIIDALVECGIVHSSLPPFKVCIDSRELFNGRTKLGLGSSAALTHALARAVIEYANECEEEEPRRDEKTVPHFSIDVDWVFNMHRAYQGGRGSGADVAAGIAGGTYRFQRLSDHCTPQITPLELPPALFTAYLWMGEAASTTDALHRLQRCQQTHPARFSHLISPLMTLAAEGVTAFENGDINSFLQIVESYGQNLAEFGARIGVDIVSDKHRQLSAIAQENGVAYKPSGAGVGDFGVAFSDRVDRLRKFEIDAYKAGCRVVKLGLGRPCQRC